MFSQETRRYYRYEALMRYAKRLGFGEIHERMDQKVGLHAIIAIHSTHRGPAIGGTRLFEYSSTGAALKDVLRLAYMMTIKAAISELPHGGAKAVIIKPKNIRDRRALFEFYGNFVHELNGRYVTAVDIGTSTKDMDIIAQQTPYVSGASLPSGQSANPSPYTARSVIKSMQAAVKFQLGKDSLEGLHVAIQGAGSVGYYLAKSLYEQGVRISVCDPLSVAVQRFVDEFNADSIDIDQIYDVNCDIFAPCAMGGVINRSCLKKLKASIIVGSANNQLAHYDIVRALDKRNILYIPDFLANSGGLIHASMIYDAKNPVMIHEKIEKLYDITFDLLERAKSTGRSTAVVATEMAYEQLSC